MTKVATQSAQYPQDDVRPSRYYRPELDILRFFAFLMVFASHTVPGDEAFYDQMHIAPVVAHFIIAVAASGSFGVDLFFALSSFLISTLVMQEKQTSGTVDVQSFYIRRVLRIFPLYFAFLLVLVPIFDDLLAKDGMTAPYVFAFALFFGNWACAFFGYPSSVAGPLWSVSIEEQFYLAWPLIIRWTHRIKTIAAVFLVISFATRWLLISRGAVHPEIWCNTLSRLDPIACGAILAAIVHRRDIDLSSCVRLLLLLASVALLAGLGRYGDFAGAKALLTFPIATLACVCLLVCAIGWKIAPCPGPVLRTLMYLGRISYGLYVFHLLFVFAFDLSLVNDAVARVTRTALALLATVAAAALSYHLYEIRFLRLKEKFRRSDRAVLAAGRRIV